MEEIEEELLRDPTATLGLGGSDSTPKQQVQKAPQVQEQEEEEEDFDFLDTIGDIALAPFRGLEGTLNGVYNLADMAMFDVLPDLDTRFLGRSKTTAGSLVEGISQFAFGFGPIFGAAGKIGALAKAGTVARGVAAGAVTDFVAFKGQEDRLSNLIQQFPELQNPVTEFLAHDANESEVEGRLKNVLEGLILEGAIGGTVTLFMKSLRALKAGKKVRDVDGGGADEVNKATSDSLGGGKALASIKSDAELDRFYYGERAKYSNVLGLDQERRIIKMDFPVSVRGETINIKELQKRLDDAIAKEDFEEANDLQFYLNNANKKIKKRMDKYVKEEGIDLKEVGLDGVDLSTIDFQPKLKELDFKGDIAEPGLSRRSGIFAGRIDDKTKDFLLKGTQAVESGKPFQTGGTIDPSVPQAATVGRTLDQLAVNADTPEVQNLAKNLKKIIKDQDDLDVVVNYKPDVEGDPTTVRGDVGDKGSIAGVYRPSTDRVELYAGADEQTLVHEMLHGVTAKKINSWVSQGGKKRSTVLSNIDNVINNKAAPKPIRELAKSFKIASEKVGKEYEFKGADPFDPEGAKGIYGFKDLDEFLVAAFADLELQRILRRIPADDQRNIFQKIVDAVAELIGAIRGKEGSTLLDKVIRDSAQIISASRGSYVGKAKLVAEGRYYQEVSKFGKSVTSSELDEFRTQHKITEIKLKKTGAHPTQRDITKATYEKIKQFLKEGFTIDFGAGKNIAVKAGIKADSFEPFPEKGFEPTFKDSSKIPSNSYDNVINNAVLNVVPQDIRDNLVREIGRILKVGGKAFINVRGKDVFNSKHTVISKENMEVIVDSTGAYQKGFTKEELVGYLGEVLGDGFDVKVSTKFGTVAAEVTKRADEGLASVKRPSELPDFKSKIETDPEWQQWTNAVRRGEKPRLPRMEMTGDIDSVHTILTEKYKNNPELVKNLDEPPNFHDEDLNTIVRDFAQKSIKDQREIAINAEIFKDVLTDSTEKLMKIVDDFDKTESIQSEAALRNQLSEVVEIYDYYRQMGKETALTLAMRRSKNPISRKIGLETSEMQNSALVKEFLNNNSGGMSAKKAVKLIKDVYNPTNPDKTLKGMLNVAKKTQGNKLLDATIEYWTNSILSGPRTQAVNFLGNLMTQVLTSLEMTAGAAIQGNMPLAKAAFASVFDVILLKEAWSSATKTLITGKEVLDIGSRSFESNMQSIGKAIDFSKEGNIDKNTINLLGSFINLPARGLLTGDELFKQLSFRRAARLKATMDAFNLGLKDSKEIADYVEGKIEKIVTTGGQVMSQESLIREGAAQADKLGLIGKPNTKKRADYIKKYVDDNFDEDAAALAQYSIEEARYYTFTKELEEKTIAKSLQNTTNNIPMLKFVLPFVRTPANILSFALERTPFAASVKIPGTDTVMSFPGLRSEALSLREGMKSNDPLLRAQTTGKLITSVTTLGLFMDMVTNNNNIFPVVTGAGPRDDRQRNMLEQTGWRPYSIKIGDTYYSYKRLDPIATLLGISADMNEMMKESDQYDEEGVEMLFMATATALARNVSNKSFLAGVQMWSEAMNDPDRFGKTLGRNYAGSFVPNVLSQMQDYDKQPLREARTWADAAMKKLPGGRDMLDPQRNLLGEEKIVDYGTMGFINPVATSEDKSDIVLEELASLKHGFRHPSSRILQGNLNLLDYVNEQGRTAHDRRLDLLQTVRVRGRTLRQTLSKLIKSSKYQKLAGFSSEVGLPSPRVQEITKVLRKFKDLANRKMYKEFPDLVSQKNNITRALQLNKQGVNRQEVLELLQQTN